MTTMKPIQVKKLITVIPINRTSKSAQSANISKKPLLKPDVTNMYTKKVLYESTDFLSGESRKIKLYNKKDITTTNILTVVEYITSKGTVIHTSKNIAALIGQRKYELVFNALKTTINNNIEAILALLTPENTVGESAEKMVKTDLTGKKDNKKSFKRMSNRAKPYVVTQKLLEQEELSGEHFSSKVIETSNFICPKNDTNKAASNRNETDVIVTSTTELLDLKEITAKAFTDKHDDSFSVLSGHTSKIPEFLDVMTIPVMNKSTAIQLKLWDGTVVPLRIKPEDLFHIACPEILKPLTPEIQKKVIYHQFLMDWVHCLKNDETGQLPIHMAAIEGDYDLLRRHCVVLKARQKTVDVTTDDDLTPLQLAILNNASTDCISILLEHGADIFKIDERHKNTFHLMSEGSPEHLEAAIKYCKRNAKDILSKNTQFWTRNLISKTDIELSDYLLKRISTLTDEQGYTPLMLASRLGKKDNVKLLVEMSRFTVNTAMQNSGITALHLAVTAACIDAKERMNSPKLLDNFKETIRLLIECGADPSISSHFGGDVFAILTEFQELKDTEILTLLAGRNVGQETNDVLNCYLVKDDYDNLNFATFKKKDAEKTESLTKLYSKTKNDCFYTEFKLYDKREIQVVKSKNVTNAADMKKQKVLKIQIESTKSLAVSKSMDKNAEKPIILEDVPVSLVQSPEESEEQSSNNRKRKIVTDVLTNVKRVVGNANCILIKNQKNIEAETAKGIGDGKNANTGAV